MKVLDLECEQGHVFEGWFASEDDFLAQHAGRLILCPVCGNDTVTRRLSAPRLNLGATQLVESPTAEFAGTDPSRAMQQQWLMACRHIIDNTVDVGTEFAAQARKIHHGEAIERSIRGRASLQEVQTLLDEGIAVVPIVLPESLKGPLQ
jgi:hypothetical protein